MPMSIAHDDGDYLCMPVSMLCLILSTGGLRSWNEAGGEDEVPIELGMMIMEWAGRKLWFVRYSNRVEICCLAVADHWNGWWW